MRASRPFTVAVSMAALLLVAGSVSSRVGDTPPGIAVDPVDVALDGITTHLRHFTAIADDHDGHRAAGTSGYEASVDYVVALLDDAGFDVARLRCDTCVNDRDESVIADWPGGDNDHVVMAGAHLDSVEEGPGSNDNSSGSAALLQIALTVAERSEEPRRHMRFAWWAEEEPGMHGSGHYVDSVGVDDLDMYINFDMVASSNAGYFIDGAGDSLAFPFVAYLTASGHPPDEMVDCCSDNVPFAEAGVPSTTLSAGYGQPKTARQQRIWGGTEGEPFDPCYHTPCDRYPDNINASAIAVIADAGATGILDHANRPTPRRDPTKLCGGGKLADRATVISPDGTVLADVWLLRNDDEYCAVTIRTAGTDTAVGTAVTLRSDDGRVDKASGSVHHHAGPVRLTADCVSVVGTTTGLDGATHTVGIPQPDC